MAGGAGSEPNFAARWPLAEAWPVAVQVTAAAYRVSAELIMAPSQGRGPRPPEQVREPKKMAIHLAVILSGCDYAALGRHIGLHKDTVSSHCADIRAAISDDDLAEVSAQSLEALARGRLQLASRHRIESVRAHLAMLETATAEVLGGSSDSHPTIHPTEVPTSRKRDRKGLAA